MIQLRDDKIEINMICLSCKGGRLNLNKTKAIYQKKTKKKKKKQECIIKNRKLINFETL